MKTPTEDNVFLGLELRFDQGEMSRTLTGTRYPGRGRPGNSGGTWEPSSEKLFSLRESFGPDFTHKSPNLKH